MMETMELQRWQFSAGAAQPDWSAAREVTVPHTWNIEPGTEELWDAGWYRCPLPRRRLAGERIFVHFRAAYHDAEVYLNGQEAGRHGGSGYTPFTVELTSLWQQDAENILTVRVSNRFVGDMLPYKRSFDWANDGGLIRPVALWITGSHRIVSNTVQAHPLIPSLGRRWDSGTAAFGVRGSIDGAPDTPLTLRWQVCRDAEGQQPFAQGELSCTAGDFEVPAQVWQQVDFWHFDAPNLYTLTLTLLREGQVVDRTATTFGFRQIRTRGSRLYLNGEPVRLCGTEWMPGSDPEYGMAEPREQLEKMLRILKESNCVYTRFHWQQDDWVYDWCDRHGMLVQEEVPFWGPNPTVAGPMQTTVFEQQIAEMIQAHGNHPSIFAWGVGNELNAQTSETIQYIKEAVARVHALDEDRFANYVTFSMYDDPARDGTTDGDILMINDYIGTWHGDRDPYAEWDRFVKANPDRAMTPSEFGLCEPAFEGGDARREAILREKMDQYRKYPCICGTIYFCLNDYRTQMGEEGTGKLRRRVHGSTDLCGNPKPSYQALKEECAPLRIAAEDGGVRLTCAADLPCYTVKGYVLVSGEQRWEIPTLCPGESWFCPGVDTAAIRICRPSGDWMW